jgi:hypothetical protein
LRWFLYRRTVSTFSSRRSSAKLADRNEWSDAAEQATDLPLARSRTERFEAFDPFSRPSSVYTAVLAKPSQVCTHTGTIALTCSFMQLRA